MRSILISSLLAAVPLLAAPPARGGEEIRWCLVELEGGERLTARFIAEEKDFYIFNFQGAPMVVAKGDVRSIGPLSPPGAASPAAAPGLAPPPKDPAPAKDRAEISPPSPLREARGGDAPIESTGKGKGLSDDEIRDALELLGSSEDEAVAVAYKALAGGFGAARLFIQEATHHQNPRVRALAVKLLGERGNPKEDLKAVALRLSDEKGNVRLAASMAMRALGPEGFPLLLRYLQDEREPNLRKMAIKTLQHWADQRAVAPLVDLLQKETDGGVKDFIAVALEALTRQKLGRDAKAWTHYLSKERLDPELLRRMGEAKREEEEKEKKDESGAGSAEE